MKRFHDLCFNFNWTRGSALLGVVLSLLMASQFAFASRCTDGTRAVESISTFEQAYQHAGLQKHASVIGRARAKKLEKVGVTVTVEEFVQDGFVRLWNAYRTGTLKVFTLPYLKRIIHNGIVDRYREEHPVKRDVRRFVARYYETKEWLERELGYEPSDKEVAVQLGVRDEVLNSKLQKYYASLRTSIDDPGIKEAALIDVLPSRDKDPFAPEFQGLPEGMTYTIFVQVVRQVLSKDRNPKVLQVFNGLLQHKNLQQIGDELGITESRVSQIRSHKIRKATRMAIENWQADQALEMRQSEPSFSISERDTQLEGSAPPPAYREMSRSEPEQLKDSKLEGFLKNRR